jgi:hypothetical protein
MSSFLHTFFLYFVNVYIHNNVMFKVIGEVPIVLGKPSKLTLEPRFLNFILYMKHDNVTMYATFMWNWSNFALYDDVIFIASCINHAP